MDSCWRKRQRCQLPVMTAALKNKAALVIRAMNEIYPLKMTPTHQSRLLQLVRSFILKVNLRFNMRKHQAPFLSWKNGHELVNKLWFKPLSGRGYGPQSPLLRKQAAVALMLALHSGSRWCDIMRLQWQDIRIITTKTHRLMEIDLRFTKGNLTNDIPQRLQYSSLLTCKTAHCPIKLLKQFWLLMDKPSKGFIVTCPTRQWLNETEIEKLGTSLINQVQHMAGKINWPPTQIPTKHSARVSMAIRLYNLKVPEWQIIKYMNWKTPEMLHYYVNVRDQRSESAPATRLANASIEALELSEEMLY